MPCIRNKPCSEKKKTKLKVKLSTLFDNTVYTIFVQISAVLAVCVVFVCSEQY